MKRPKVNYVSEKVVSFEEVVNVVKEEVTFVNGEFSVVRDSDENSERSQHR